MKMVVRDMINYSFGAHFIVCGSDEQVYRFLSGEELTMSTSDAS